MKKKTKDDTIIIPRKAMLGIAPAIVIMIILFTRHKAAEALLFFVGISAGVVICRNWKKK